MSDQEVGVRHTSYGVEPVFPIGGAPRVSMEDVLAEIVGESYTVLPSGRVTVCVIRNGSSYRAQPKKNTDRHMQEHGGASALFLYREDIRSTTC